MRADHIAQPTLITDDILAHIRRARFLIAALTGQNASVFYDVGLSHALGKELILLLQKGCKAPFDIQGIVT